MQSTICDDNGCEQHEEPEENSHRHALPSYHIETMALTNLRAQMRLIVSQLMNDPGEQAKDQAHRIRNKIIGLEYFHTPD